MPTGAVDAPEIGLMHVALSWFQSYIFETSEIFPYENNNIRLAGIDSPSLYAFHDIDFVYKLKIDDTHSSCCLASVPGLCILFTFTKELYATDFIFLIF